MTPETVMEIGVRTMTVTALLAAPLLLSALVVGLLIGMLQAATQINEMTLTFVPKLMMVALVLVFALSLRLRQRELQTIFRLGCSRATIVRLLGAEILLILLAAAALSALVLLALQGHQAALVRHFFL